MAFFVMSLFNNEALEQLLSVFFIYCKFMIDFVITKINYNFRIIFFLYLFFIQKF